MQVKNLKATVGDVKGIRFLSSLYKTFFLSGELLVSFVKSHSAFSTSGRDPLIWCCVDLENVVNAVEEKEIINNTTSNEIR